MRRAGFWVPIARACQLIGHSPKRASSARAMVAGGIALAGLAVSATLGSPAAAAAPATVASQLSLTGLVSGANPVGGSVLGVHPGDTVSFSAATAPTAGLDKLGLGGLLSGVLGGVTGFQVDADFHGLPGGKAETLLGYRGAPDAAFTFPTAGTYSFTWTAKSLNLLGGLVPVNLDGNQLARAGVKLNAGNQYVGQVVVAANPPAGGIGVQLPKISAAPQVGPITLPTVTVPPITVDVPVPSIPGVPASVPTGPPSPASTPPAGPVLRYTPPGLPVQEGVVPKGSGGSDSGDSGVGPDGAGSSLLAAGSDGSGAAPKGPGATIGVRPSGTAAPVGLAANERQQPPPLLQLPVAMSILAIVAFALVTAAFARTVLLRRGR